MRVFPATKTKTSTLRAKKPCASRPTLRPVAARVSWYLDVPGCPEHRTRDLDRVGAEAMRRCPPKPIDIGALCESEGGEAIIGSASFAVRDEKLFVRNAKAEELEALDRRLREATREANREANRGPPEPHTQRTLGHVDIDVDVDVDIDDVDGRAVAATPKDDETSFERRNVERRGVLSPSDEYDSFLAFADGTLEDSETGCSYEEILLDGDVVCGVADEILTDERLVDSTFDSTRQADRDASVVAAVGLGGDRRSRAAMRSPFAGAGGEYADGENEGKLRDHEEDEIERIIAVLPRAVRVDGTRLKPRGEVELQSGAVVDVGFAENRAVKKVRLESDE